MNRGLRSTFELHERRVPDVLEAVQLACLDDEDVAAKRQISLPVRLKSRTGAALLTHRFPRGETGVSVPPSALARQSSGIVDIGITPSSFLRCACLRLDGSKSDDPGVFLTEIANPVAVFVSNDAQRGKQLDQLVGIEDNRAAD